MVDTMDPVSTTAGGSLVGRMVRAARLDVSLYEEVEADTTATSQAAIVVAIVAIASAIGSILAIAIFGVVGNVILAALSGLVGAFLNWILFSYLAYFIGTRLFGGTATPGELLRTIGFAQSPGILGFFVFIPVLGWLLGFALLIWILVGGVIAVRQALDFDTSKAVITAVVAAIPYIAIRAIITGIVGI